jgi:hypothetical protein
MLNIMEEIYGTLGRGLERAFAVAFGRVICDNPFFQKYEWWIVGCVIGLPALWMATKEMLKPQCIFQNAGPAAKDLWQVHETQFVPKQNQIESAVAKAVKHPSAPVHPTIKPIINELVKKHGANIPTGAIHKASMDAASEQVYGPNRALIQGVLKYIAKTDTKKADMIFDAYQVIFEEEIPERGGFTQFSKDMAIKRYGEEGYRTANYPYVGKDKYGECREKHPSNIKPESAQQVKHGNLRTAVRNTLHKARVDISVGFRIPFVMSIIALLVAINANVSYDFFVLLRVLVFVTCIACGTALWKTDQKGTTWFWIMVSIAVIYNPLLPIHLKRETWVLINVVTIPVFCLLYFLIKRHRVVA